MTYRRFSATLVAGMLLWGSALAAQVPDSTARRQQRTLDSLGAVLRRLQARIDSLTAGRPRGDTTANDELAALRAAASAAGSDSTAAARPQQARLGQNAMNPEISVTGDIRGTAYRPGPQADNFVAREFELGFQSALDPYTTAKITASFGHGETPAIEEGYFYFPALPGGFRMDIGRFRQEIGELNRWHLHAVPEDEYPLVIRRYGSNEGVSGTGVSLYHTLPSGRAGTYELTLQGTTGDNEVLYAGGSHLSGTAKLAAFWQLSRATYLMTSISGAYGTNPDTGLTTRLGVVAARFTWRPPQRANSREMTLRGELWQLKRSFAGPAGGKWRTGWYADGTWKLSRRYILGARYDRVQSPDTLATEWAVTPSLTYWQSEFVFLRALWEHAHDVLGANHDRFTIQAVFAMGPHKHELF